MGEWRIGGPARLRDGSPSCTEQDVILTDAIADTLGTNYGLIDSDSTTYRVPTADTNLAGAFPWLERYRLPPLGAEDLSRFCVIRSGCELGSGATGSVFLPTSRSVGVIPQPVSTPIFISAI